jgi:hypothetical protein
MPTRDISLNQSIAFLQTHQYEILGTQHLKRIRPQRIQFPGTVTAGRPDMPAFPGRP